MVTELEKLMTASFKFLTGVWVVRAEVYIHPAVLDLSLTLNSS